MKKKLIFIFICIFFVASYSYAQHVDKLIDDNTFEERIKSLQIPSNVISTLSTEEVLQACLSFPYYIDFFSYGGDYDAFIMMSKEFNGFEELFKREDCGSCLLNEYMTLAEKTSKIKSADKLKKGALSLKTLMIEYMLLYIYQHEGKNKLDSNNLIKALSTNITLMNDHKDIFSNIHKIPICDIIKCEKDFANDSIVNRAVIIYIPTSLTTPNGSPILSAYLFSGIDYNESEKAELINDFIIEYNLSEDDIIGEPTYNYNCHSFAWHMSQGGSYVWINGKEDNTPNGYYLSPYWNDGSFLQTTSNDNNYQQILYAGDHSALHIGNGLFLSKWGSGPLVKHLPNQVPPAYLPSQTKMYFKRFSISGPVAPCNSDVYSVTNLPSGYNVIWSWHPTINPLSNLEGTMGKKGLPLDSNLVFPPFPPIIESITLMQNTPATNQCTIVIPSGTNALGTLKTTIKKNGTTICVLEKNLDSSSGFYGTYTRTHVGSPTIGPNQFSSGSTIIANYGDVVTLQSPYFIDANISKTSTIPLSWTNNNGTISFTIPMNSQGGNSAATISFSGTNEDYCMSFGFTIYVNATDQLMAPTPDYELQIESEGQSYSFSMAPIEDCKSDNMLNNPAISWELTIVNTNTGQIVYNRETTGSTLTINTESWKEGIYAARAVIGDDVITKKITYIIK